MILSSAHDANISLSLGFHDISEILWVCPACTNSNSGGPSFFSSSVCGLSNLDKSQMLMRLSLLAEAKRFEWYLLNFTDVTSSLWLRRENNLHLRFRRSHTATVLSTDDVARRFTSNGLKSMPRTSATWASTTWAGLASLQSHLWILGKSCLTSWVFCRHRQSQKCWYRDVTMQHLPRLPSDQRRFEEAEL